MKTKASLMKAVALMICSACIFQSCQKSQRAIENTAESETLMQNSKPGLIVAENGRTLAFPGAEGFGRFATGARGVANPSVYVVTNLNDAGAGSFRDAVSKSGRFIVFAVTGVITLKSNLAFKPNTTIAGETAPGKGIFIYGRKATFSGAYNTIVRNIRIRLGINAGAGKSDDASGIANGKNLIFDHVSVAWGQDETFSINWDNKGYEPDSITLQNCIIAQGLNRHNHSAGGLIQTGGRISILKSLYASNKTRNPKVKGYNEFVNNVVYNWGNYGNPMGHSVSGDAYIMGGESSGTSWANIIGNYFISGPLTEPNERTPFSRGSGTFNLYAADNYFDANKNGILDGSLVPENSTGYPGLAASNFMSVPFAYPGSSNPMTAFDAFKYVAKNAGAMVPHRDEIDQLLIDELRSVGTKGIYVYRESDIPLANGGLGEFQNPKAPKDKDGDGIPDSWEKKLGLNPSDKADALLPNTTYPGYLNIEVYMHAAAAN